MAYATERFSENAGGMAGWGALAIYDGGGTTAQGGDTLDLVSPVAAGSINSDGFFTGQEVFDAVARVSAVQRAGRPGLLCLIRSRGNLIFDIIRLDTNVTPPRLELRGNQDAGSRIT